MALKGIHQGGIEECNSSTLILCSHPVCAVNILIGTTIYLYLNY